MEPDYPRSINGTPLHIDVDPLQTYLVTHAKASTAKLRVYSVNSHECLAEVGAGEFVEFVIPEGTTKVEMRATFGTVYDPCFSLGSPKRRYVPNPVPTKLSCRPGEKQTIDICTSQPMRIFDSKTGMALSAPAGGSNFGVVTVEFTTPAACDEITIAP